VDLLFLADLARLGVFLPIFVSLWCLVALWREAELYGVQEWLFCGWFVVALIMQLFAHSTGIWLIGLLAQVILAIVLLLKKRMDEIY
jgi:hypothetical protein